MTQIRWWSRWGVTFANVRWEKGLRDKMAKSSRWGSISGAPSEMGVDISGGRWCSCADKVVVMARRCIRKREAGEGAEGQNGEIEPLGLDFERAVGNGGRYQWGEVVLSRG